MSDNIIWWAGAIHLAIYAALGTALAISACVVKVHMHAKVVGRIVAWHAARARWKSRHTDGLTDSEWAKGEPRP